ncbi:outer membrane protein assembly factor BamB family protein [Paractinoplanes atraurantiacus]|uniref:PQQ-like domain-containing protein n=1 Tax=Paractinoplanes atraurantiacus TaxID=1036182 RepID=A0A285IQW9_9ACTN|nr:PQQ-binding-like beta-propeller repeat protein [Actinoplanes atraurantiacus]SNY49486.1 PQQ-like domain-containing protein [Actinoplanes atraurantiacus]
MALIELDLTAQPEPAPSSPPPAHRYRISGLILAAVLVIALGASAPAEPVLWRYLGAVPVTRGLGEPFELAGGRAYTMAEIGSGRDVTSWSLAEPPEQAWKTRYQLPEENPDDLGYGGFHVDQAGDVVLTSHGPITTVLDRHSGQTRWSVPMAVTPLAGGRIGLIQEPRFRPGTVYDQESGDPGALYFTASGEPHVEPPARTDLRGVDLYTGATVWTAGAAGSVIAATAPGDRPAVLLLSSDGLERIDGVTGKVLRRTVLPEVDGRAPVSGELVGDLMMIYYHNTDGYLTYEAAYSPETLAPAWTRQVRQVLVQQAVCSGLSCADAPAGLQVLDPATGKPLWQAPAGIDVALYGDYVLETENQSGEPVRLVDLSTGATRVDLRGWRAQVPGPPGRPIVLRRGLDGGVSAFGLVDPDRGTVQVLGTTGMPISDCSSDTRRVVCRADDSLRIWAYRG